MLGMVEFAVGLDGGDALLDDEVCIINPKFVSQKASIESFCKSQFPHEFVNLSFIITYIKNELTDLCGNWGS